MDRILSNFYTQQWILGFIAFLLIFTISSCRWKDQPISFDGKVLTYQYNGGIYRFTALSDHIIRVQYSDPYTTGDSIYAPVLNSPVNIIYQSHPDYLILATSDVEVRINKVPFSIAFSNRDGQVKCEIEPWHVFGQDSVQLIMGLGTDEEIYGLGARAVPMNRKGNKFLYYNMPHYGYGWGTENLNYGLPHYTSSKNYMLLIDSPSRAWFDVGVSEANQIVYSSSGSNTSFYYINGDDMESMIVQYTELTGRQPMPPLWALGNLQSRFGYRSRIEAETAVEKSLSAGFPVDAVILDLYWFGPELEDGKMGQLYWDTAHWPEPTEMIKKWRDKNIHTVLVTEPFFTKKSYFFDSLAKVGFLTKDTTGNAFIIDDFYFGPAGLLDIFHPEAALWMWNQYNRLKQDGIAGWWVDLGEPEKHPDAMVHQNGQAPHVHGLYGHVWSRMMYEGHQRDFPDERFFLLTRSGYAGTQRFGIIPWTGDVARDWNGLKAQPGMMLSAAFSGLGMMHSDAGGFTFTSEIDEELYIRWLQYAAFTPVFRPHGDEILPSEPAFWSKQVRERVKNSIKLRYQLMPYLYTMIWQNSTIGQPLARPVLDTGRNTIDSIPGAYFWGPALLVVPVLEKGLIQMKISFPEGKWYDFYTGEPIEGGKTYSKDITLEYIPVYAREGSLIPMALFNGNTSQYQTDSFIIRYYYSDQDSEALIYMDDGFTPWAYERGHYQIIEIANKHEENAIHFSVNVTGEGFQGSSDRRHLLFEIRGLESKPARVSGNAEVHFEWNDKRQLLLVSTILEKETEFIVHHH